VSRSATPQVTFADWEFLQQGIVLEPALQAVSDFLDDHDELVEAIRGYLQHGLKNPQPVAKV
jgi:ABC-type transporter Mla subunit MlaD